MNVTSWWRPAAALASIALVATAAGCGSSSGSGSGSDGGDMRVAALFLDSQGYYGGVKYGFEQAAKRNDVSLKLTQTNSAADPSAESEFINTIVGSKPDALIISATSVTASVPAIRQAAQAGIPVVCYNTCIQSADLEKYVAAYALGDPIRFGEMIGSVAADYFVARRIRAPKIAVVNCEFVEVCVDRRKGFMAAVQKRVPGATIVANQEGSVADKAVSVAQNILHARPDVDAFFGEAGGATEGSVRAIQASGKSGEVVVFGSDMTPDIAKALRDGSILLASVDISGRTMGERTFEIVQRILDGERFDDKVVPVPIKLWRADQPETIEEWSRTHANGLP